MSNEVIRGLFQLESQLATEIKEKIVGYGGRAFNMHGNQHQAGIPDLLVRSRRGNLSLFELKIDRRKTHHPFQAYKDFEKFLEGAQVGVMSDLLKHNAKAGIVIYDQLYSMRDGKDHVVHVYAPHLFKTPTHIDVASFSALAASDTFIQ